MLVEELERGREQLLVMYLLFPISRQNSLGTMIITLYET